MSDINEATLKALQDLMRVIKSPVGSLGSGRPHGRAAADEVQAMINEIEGKSNV